MVLWRTVRYFYFLELEGDTGVIKPLTSIALLFASLNLLSCGSSSPTGGTGSTGLVSGVCTYVSPPLTQGASDATLCYTYTNMPVNAATGGSGICPGVSGNWTVTTVTSCPTTLGTTAAAQLGTCTINVPALGATFPAYSYTALYYAGADYTTCSAAHQGCINQSASLSGYSSSWAGINGCN